MMPKVPREYSTRVGGNIICDDNLSPYIQLTEEKLKGSGFEAGDPITIEVRRGLILIYAGEE